MISRVSKIVKYTENMRIEVASFTPDGGSLVTGSVDGMIEVWDPITAKVRSDLPF